MVGVPGRHGGIGRGADHVSGTEQQDARPAAGCQFHCVGGDSRSHADQAGPPRRLHPRIGTPLRAVVGAHRQTLAGFVHHHLPLQRGDPLLGARGRLGLLRRALSVMERKPASRDRHLDECCPGPSRRLGRLDPASPSAVTAAMNVASMKEFAYDPFDPAVMADPLPYYRVLRERYPVYYLPKWDTFALSRFADIWDVLAVNDGTFVASEGTLPAATVLARHNQGPVADPPWDPLPFHANFDSPIYDGVRRAHSQPFRPKSAAGWEARIRELANDRLDELLARGTFDLTQDYGGIVVASVVCELLGIPVEFAADVLASVNAGSLAEPGSGVDTAEARPNYLEYLI